jgi:hypothetical protein
LKFATLSTGTCFIKKIYAVIATSSSLLQGKHLPFTPSPLCLNIFRLFVILSLTQLYQKIKQATSSPLRLNIFSLFVIFSLTQ